MIEGLEKETLAQTSDIFTWVICHKLFNNIMWFLLKLLQKVLIFSYFC